jgi:hypothetical protein
METMVIDANTLIVKSDNAEDLLGVVNYINQNRQGHVKELLTFATKHRIRAEGYKFNRDDCYDR